MKLMQTIAMRETGSGFERMDIRSAEIKIPNTQ